jgi:hypothetical protein
MMEPRQSTTVPNMSKASALTPERFEGVAMGGYLLTRWIGLHSSE